MCYAIIIFRTIFYSSLTLLCCVSQNLKQQRSRREQFSNTQVASSPLLANNFGKKENTAEKSQERSQKHYWTRNDMNPIKLQSLSDIEL